MPLELIKVKAISGVDKLDFDKKNYVPWAETASDPAAGDSDLPIWIKNVNIAQAGIRMNIGSAERDYLRNHCTIASAYDIWVELKKRHREKASTQTSLLDDLLAIHIARGADMVEAAGKVRNISKQKWEDDDKATPSDVIKSLEKEKLRWEEEMKPKLAEEKANAARAGRTPLTNSTGRGLCETCKGPHRTDECWGSGGAMQGRRDKVLARRAARRAGKQPDKPANTSNNAKQDAPAAKPAARPRIGLKDGNGKTVYFTIADDDSETAASTLTAITSNAELEEIYNTYHAHPAHRSRHDSDVSSEYSMHAATEQADIEMELSDAESDVGHIALATGEYPPFAADSGKGKLGLKYLQIYGVSGACIEATAKGDIHIRQTDNTVFVVKDALYVPNATMCLLSIGRIADTGLTAAFTKTQMLIIGGEDNTVMATGTRRDKKLYSLDSTILPRPDPIVSANIAASDPAPMNLEVWH
ncbi:hypothetical protein K438DRAFT_1971886 [Mycena galopus ATCC 62051]|nr:hypothetical protein K438DRAFT_1971886 [Mycena galopus ATCC 62051]